MREKRFSSNVYLLSLFFAFIYLFNLYIIQSLFWALVGFSSILTLLIFVFDDVTLRSFYKNLALNSYSICILYFVAFIIYFYSSVSGLFILFSKLFNIDAFFYAIPLSIISMIIFGTIIGMLQKLIKSMR